MAAAFKWRNATNNAFTGANTSVNVGGSGTAPLFTDGSYTAGDILIACVIVESDAGDTINPPGGWTTVAPQRETTTGHFQTGWFWHLCDGSETGSFHFTWTNSHFMAWTLTNYSGCVASPFDGTPVSGTGTTTFTTSSVTTSNAGSLLVLLTGNGAVTTIPPADMTNRFNQNMESDSAGGTINDRTPGAPGTYSESFSITNGSGEGNWMLAALAPLGSTVPQGQIGLTASEW